MDFCIEWHDRLASTNAFMRNHLNGRSGMVSGTIVAAREQTAGRGRQERKWMSAPGQNLCFSLFIQTDAALIEVPSLTMSIALAIAENLKTLHVPAAPKWPNDVLVDGKKICGILSERVERPLKQDNGIIVGIGLNVNMTAADAELIDRPATSFLIETGKAFNVESTLDALLPYLDHWINEWQQGGFERIRERWTLLAGPIGKPLTVHDGDLLKTGKLAGFGKHGELLLQTASGIETIWSGDVS